MNIDARIRQLDSRHQNLDTMIDEEMKRPAQDSLRLSQLKKEKLKLKEEIEALRGGH